MPLSWISETSFKTVWGYGRWVILAAVVVWLAVVDQQIAVFKRDAVPSEGSFGFTVIHGSFDVSKNSNLLVAASATTIYQRASSANKDEKQDPPGLGLLVIANGKTIGDVGITGKFKNRPDTYTTFIKPTEYTSESGVVSMVVVSWRHGECDKSLAEICDNSGPAISVAVYEEQPLLVAFLSLVKDMLGR